MYKAYECRTPDRATFWAALQPFLGEIGWEEYDVIDADTIVYRSNGESGNEPYGYIHIDAGTSTYIEFTAYQYWNLATHTGVRKMWAYNTQSVSRIGSFTVTPNTYSGTIFAGDKNLVLVGTGMEGGSINSTCILFGHLGYRYDNVLTNAEGTHGTAGTIFVASTSGLGVGKYVQIVGGTSGCDTTYITEMVDANTIKVAALPRDYGTGAVLGSPASTFGIISGASAYSSRWHQTSFYGDAGTTVGASYVTVTQIVSYASLINFSKKYQTSQIVVQTDSATAPGIALGGYGTNFPYLSAGLGYDVFLEEAAEEYGNVVYGAGSTLKCKNTWSVNEHADKFVIITTGISLFTYGGTLWQARKILSNTADTLTLDSDWYVNPDASCGYAIVKSFWRRMPAYAPFTANLLKITDCKLPS